MIALLGLLTLLPTPNAAPSSTYRVTVDRQPVVAEAFKDVAYAHFAFAGEARVTVTVTGGLGDYRLSPVRQRIPVARRGDTLSFTLARPENLILQCAGHEKLFLFADPPEVRPPALGAPGVVSVLDYVSDRTGQSLQRAQLQRALDAVAARPEGGVLYFPAGVYLTGSLIVHSHTTIYLASGALLQGTANPRDYRGALLTFQDADGSRLIGRGTVAMRGTEIRRVVRDHPRICNLVRSRHCEIADVVLRDSGGFNIHALQCEDLRLHGYRIVNDLTLSNQDGTDPDSSRHIVVDGVFMYTSDDAIAVKADAGLCEDVVVRNCVFWTKKSALKVGSDPYFGARNIRFEHNDVVHSDRALALYARQGFIEDVRYTGNAAEIVGGDTKQQTIVFLVSKVGPGGETGTRKGAPYTGHIRHVLVDGLQALTFGPQPSVIRGDGPGHEVSDVVIRNYFIDGRPVESAAAGHIEIGPYAQQVQFKVDRIVPEGAFGDGKTLNTAAIQRAIDQAGAAGGGTVYFPPGRWLTGSLILRSHVTLELGRGAVLLGSTRMADYPSRHLLFADGADDLAIVGEGTIDGQGDAFFDRDMRPADERPSPLIEIWNCRHLRIEGISIRQAPAWTIHPKNCDDVTIRGISLLNNLRALNTDGIDVDSSRHVAISNCHIEAGDDCIVLKTTRRGDGPVQPTEDVTVDNCQLVSAASALKLGTESHGDFRHIRFSHCTIGQSRTGIGLLAKDGGNMEDVRFSDISMTTAPKWGQGLEWPIVVDVEKRTEASRLSHIRDVSFADITVTGRGRIMVSGTPDSPIEQVRFSHLTMRFTGYEAIQGAKKMRGGSHTVASGMPDFAAEPAAMIFGYVRGLNLDGIAVTWPQVRAAPERQVISGHAVAGFHLTGLQATASVPGAPAVNVEAAFDPAALREAIRDNFFVPKPLPDPAGRIHRRFPAAPGVRAEAVTYTTEFGMRVPAILYLPDPLPAAKVPAFIVVNGHGGDKYAWYSYYTGIAFARGGMAVLTYDQPGEGERSATRRSGTREHDRLKGGAIMARRLCGLMLTDVMQAVSYLQSRPEIDASRIGAGGYSLGSFVMTIAGAVEPRLRVSVMVGGGNLDGPGEYWDKSGKQMCQGLPYQSLDFLGDRPAVLYALQADRGPALAWNGRADNVVNMTHTQEPFWNDLRARAAKVRGSADGLFDYGFTPAGSHRPYWVTRGPVLWLGDKLGFPNWTRAQIEALPLSHISEWSRRVGVPIDKLYATEEREGGAQAILNDVPGIAREQLSVFTPEQWQREKGEMMFDVWTARALTAPQ